MMKRRVVREVRWNNTVSRYFSEGLTVGVLQWFDM